MKRNLPVIIILFSASLALLIFSCKKDTFIYSTEAGLGISVDTLKYDTVFTTVGSTTRSFKIFNNNDQKLRLSKVKLMGGSSSAYRMNVDGAASNEAVNIDIAANDSIYVFISVNIDPGISSLPFVVSDSILINYNGNDRYVQLQAYGQNANFLRNNVITGNTVWTNNLPYVILGSIRIDSSASLTIQPGCRIYSHADAPFIVDGTLIVNGTKTDSVVFAGDRLDEDHKDLPAGWPGIYFRGQSKDNVLQYAIVKNAYQAIATEKPSLNTNPKVTLHQCVIDNAFNAGILAVNSSLQADNSLISNCGSNIAINYGGTYNLTHCTVVGYSNYYIDHKEPSLLVTDNALLNGSTVTADLTAVFRNCIFWGDGSFVDDEVSVDKQGTGIFNVLFEHNIYKGKNSPANSTLTNNIQNVDPSFDSVNVYKKLYDLRITKNAVAPGINKGVVTSFPFDLDNKDRDVGLPDIGCYEKQ